LIGLLGGTFDPVHLGHLHAARVARAGLNLAAVHLILAARPAHRASPAASAEDRWAMLKLAVAGERGLVADDRELRRPGRSYAVDTLEDVRAQFGPAEPLVWLLGWDAFRELEGWYRWERLPELAHLAIFRRPGAAGDLSPAMAALCASRQTSDAGALQRAPAGALHFLETEMLDISATGIRARVQRGVDAADLLAPAVWTYITDRQLYRGTPH
jgi:nicotinate-nucleotide adenylyltransferase